MRRTIMLLTCAAAMLQLMAACVYCTPMHRELPGSNREALGTTDSVIEEPPVVVREDVEM